MLDEFRSTLITWDKATSRIYSPVTANESDENGRKLVVQIVNSGQVEDLTGATLHLYWETRDKLHDGLDVFKAVDLKKGEFELSYTTGMLSNKGVLNANLVLIDTVGRVVSELFKITVTEGIDNDAIQSENSFSSLTQALIDISNLEQNYAPRLNDLTAQLQQTEQELTAQLAQTMNKFKTQHDLAALFYKKLMRKENVTVVCQGDSLTYGQDSVSSDIVQPTGKTDNGVAHSFPRAGITYPAALQAYLRQVYSNTSIVINKGFSGDWVEESTKHWNVNSNADAAFIMLGTNDSNLGATWVPPNILGDITKYMADLRKLIEQYSKWGTAVFLLSPIRLYNQEAPTTTISHNTEPYRLAMKLLAEEYGCIFIDSETFLNGCDNTYYSDSVHLNSKGYQYFASRLMSVLIGYGEKNKVILRSGDTLAIRSTRDNFVNDGAVFDSHTGSLGPEESTSGTGLLLQVPAGKSLYYGFETQEDNLVFIPIFSLNANTQATTILDFGNEQGSIPLLSSTYMGLPQGNKPISIVTSAIPSANVNSYDGAINPTTPTRFLHITNRGWHNIQFTNTSDGVVYLNGFVILSYEDFIQRKTMEDWKTISALNGWTTNIRYKKNEIGMLELKESIGSGTKTIGTVLFTLPINYRPLVPKYLHAPTYNTTTPRLQSIKFDTNGEVSIYKTDSDQYISFDGFMVSLD